MSHTYLAVRLAAAALIALPAACTSHQSASIDPDFGAAVSHNIAVQTLNPEAGPPDDSASIDGQKAQQAIEAYRAEPEPVSTESLILNVGGE
ncbi:MAG: hypothetical protein RLZZ227_656 [Pseudomonadota bacterium]|jgi:type IV pilus biogenesis protein CpaD/CtpE